MAESSKSVPVTAKGAENAGMVPVGDHLASDLADSYRDNPDKPAKESIAQVQDVPKGWPGSNPAQ